jgi:hypothetical protein
MVKRGLYSRVKTHEDRRQTMSIRSLSGASVILAAAIGFAVAAGDATPYTVITLDGHRFLAVSKPEVRGLEAYVRLLPRGQLAVIKEELIDWKRTEAINRKSETIAVPADATLVDGSGSPRSDVGLAIALVRKEHAGLIDLRQKVVERQDALRAELGSLEEQDAATARAADDAPGRAARIRTVLEEIQTRLHRIDSRLERLRGEAARLGAPVD